MARTQLAHRLNRLERRHRALDAAIHAEIQRLQATIGEQATADLVAHALRVVTGGKPC